MCGIAGLVGVENESRVKAMLKKITHRGPDGEGYYAPNHDIGFGHTRLAINDLSELGHQPMVSVDGNLTMVVNGEIYNYTSLRDELTALGATFRSHCDSEVVLHAYHYWGLDAFAKLNGMFAIGLYDKSKNLVLLVRDRLGIKPLYYHHNQNEFIFASEIKAITAVMHQSKTINPIALKQYLTYANTIQNQTFCQNIFLVKPGHILSYRPNENYTEAPYWELSFNTQNNLSFEESVQQFQSTFQQSVSRHLLSDVDVATYLSAGFDSASVTANVAKIKARPVSYTATFSEGGWYDESTVASEIANQYASKHEKIIIKPDDLPRVMDKLVFSLDEPKMGMSSFSQFVLAEHVSKSHKVILTGHGGDELFSGYPIFKLLHMIDALKQSPQKLPQILMQLRMSETPHFAYFLLSFLKPRAYQQFLPVLNSEKQISRGLNKNWSMLLSDIPPDEAIIALPGDTQSYVEKAYKHYLQIYLPGLLIVEDKISMAHALESRTPFLDNEMLALSLKVSQSNKLHQNQLKALIKTAAREWLPESIYTQPKRGFPTPLRIWLRRELKDWLTTRIAGKQSALREFFDDKWLQKTCDQYLNSSKQRFRPLDEIPSHRMWQLLCLESYFRQF